MSREAPAGIRTRPDCRVSAADYRQPGERETPRIDGNSFVAATKIAASGMFGITDSSRCRQRVFNAPQKMFPGRAAGSRRLPFA
ncbi:hypothetical protein [Burkholderia gladioli]|uniref:hypothetical protein n=1 Tax=Burkholderia gladioli TaxID=28095 RepID=UPI0020B1C9F2|nr:hypothetical protein [Burkholderia gladioli]